MAAADATGVPEPATQGISDLTLKDNPTDVTKESWQDPEPPLLFYISRTGYNDIAIYKGAEKPSKADVPVYFVDVDKKIAGWDLVLKEGADAKGKPLLSIKKKFFKEELLGIDKGAHVTIEHHPESEAAQVAASQDEMGANMKVVAELNGATPSDSEGKVLEIDTNGPDAEEHAGADKPAAAGEPAGEGSAEAGSEAPKKSWSFKPAAMLQTTTSALKTGATFTADAAKDAGAALMNPKGWFDAAQVKEPGEGQVTAMTRKHCLRNNKNEFAYEGHRYEWDYIVWVGATLRCKDLDTGEEVAVCKLKPKHFIAWQTISDWSFRIDGPLEVHGSGKQHLPIILATLAAMLEWRKHNNKVWIIAATIA